MKNVVYQFAPGESDRNTVGIKQITIQFILAGKNLECPPARLIVDQPGTEVPLISLSTYGFTSFQKTAYFFAIRNFLKYYLVVLFKLIDFSL